MLLFTAWITITADETPMEIDLELNKPIVEQTCNLSHSVYLEEAPCFKATYGSALTEKGESEACSCPDGASVGRWSHALVLRHVEAE